MDTLYITGTACRRVRRLARRGAGIALVAAGETAPRALGRRWTERDSASLRPLREALALTNADICLRVPTRGSRVRVKNMRSELCAAPLPPGSFDQVVPSVGPLAGALPENMVLMVDSAGLAFVAAARQLADAVRHGRLGRHEALVRLLALGLEECSTYVLDPWNPPGGECAYDVPMTARADGLREYLTQAYGIRGLGLAREAAEQLFDRAASPMEALLVAALSLPPDWGGLGLMRPSVNSELPLEEWSHLMLNHADHLTPDLVWVDLKIVIEYLGKLPHEGSAAQDEDSGRVQDYQVLGYCVLPVRNRHVQSPREFNRLAMRLAEVMERRGVQGVRAWLDELLGDEDFLARQRVLFKVMLPAVQW